MTDENKIIRPAVLYADQEMQYFPAHWDEQTRQLVRFMLTEAYNAGHNTGYELGMGTGEGVAVGMLYDVIERLQKARQR
jgi:hypothetical protein